MRIRFIFKLAGRFSRPLLSLLIVVPQLASAGPINYQPRSKQLEQLQIPSPPPSPEWRDYESKIQKKEQRDRVDGISYLISGSLALIGGLAGQGLTSDPLEKGVYTLFQTIGVASIGYGIFVWRLGDEDRMVYESISQAPGLSPAARGAAMKSYFKVKADRESRQKFVRAITHGLIAGLNFYGATQQKNESVKNALVFLGGVNVLAVVSYSF